MTKIAIIAGTTRPGRFGEQPANWVFNYAKTHFADNAEFDLIDLKEVNLPLFDEPQPPATGVYENAHTQEWSKKIADYDGYIIVTGEYNHSIPAALKNAVDFLWKEWNFKPVSFVSYGAAAGGLRAVEHFRAIAGQMQWFDLREVLSLPHYYTNLDENGVYKWDASHEATASKLIGENIFWSEKMKPAREELAAKA